MKKVLSIFFVLASITLFAQGQEQSGIAAKITAANGRQFPVFLQGMKDDEIVFQLYKSTSNKAVPAHLITNVEFVGRFDADGIEQFFSTGDYQGMIDKMNADLKPSFDDYWQYMSIDNNLQDIYTMLMKAYLRMGNDVKASEAAAILLKNPDAGVKGQAESIAIIAALGEGRVSDAEAMLGEINSAPGKLYLGACVERAKGLPKQAIQLITQLIAEYGNDLDWMPQAELLSAHLYVDMGMTNSAINTARQVKNIYAKSDVGNEAARFQEELVLAQQKAEEAAKAKAEKEEADRAAVKARAAERAKGYGFNVDTESEEANSVDQEDGGTADGSATGDQEGTEESAPAPDA